MRLVCNIIPLEATSFLGLIFIPIGFIFCSFNLYLSDLFDFIVVDRKHHTFNVMIVEIRFGLSSIIWLLEANQSENESITIWTSSNTNTFYLPLLNSCYEITSHHASVAHLLSVCSGNACRFGYYSAHRTEWN